MGCENHGFLQDVIAVPIVLLLAENISEQNYIVVFILQIAT